MNLGKTSGNNNFISPIGDAKTEKFKLKFCFVNYLDADQVNA